MTKPAMAKSLVPMVDLAFTFRSILSVCKSVSLHSTDDDYSLWIFDNLIIANKNCQN
jgi:hypothetical protein